MYRRFSRAGSLSATELQAIREEMANNNNNNKDYGSSRQPVTLYLVRLSPTCRTVWLYLLQHDIPHHLVDVDFSNTDGAPDFFVRFPHKEVPVLVDGDVTVFEAPAILRYLSSQYCNGAGYGLTMSTRALVDSVVSWANSELHRVVGYFYAYPQFLDKYRLEDESANNQVVEHGIKHMSKYLERLENGYLSEVKPYLCGDRLTVADTFVATVLLQAEWTGFKFTLWPRVLQWLRRVRSQEYWTDVHVVHQKFVTDIESAPYCFD